MILKQQNFIKNIVISSLKKIKFDFNNIYIYCANVFAQSAVKNFKKNKFYINSIYDDDLTLCGQKISNILIKTLPKEKFKKKFLKKGIFVVCIQNKKTFINICNRLIEKGFQKRRIIHLHF